MGIKMRSRWGHKLRGGHWTNVSGGIRLTCYTSNASWNQVDYITVRLVRRCP